MILDYQYTRIARPDQPWRKRRPVGGTGRPSRQVAGGSAQVQTLQEAYLRKVVDSVGDLPNVLYEVANESSGDNAESVQLPDGLVPEDVMIPTSRPPIGRSHGLITP